MIRITVMSKFQALTMKKVVSLKPEIMYAVGKDAGGLDLEHVKVGQEHEVRTKKNMSWHCKFAMGFHVCKLFN